MVNVKTKTDLQAEMLFNRLQKRFRHLKKWAKRINTNAFRLYDRDIPEIPLVLDYYAGGVSGYLYDRPYEKDERKERFWLGEMKKTISSVLQIQEENIFLKERKRQRGKGQYEKFLDKGFLIDVYENGITFRVNLSDYLDTGLFLDRRKLRVIIQNESRGKKVLNLFCYTASFSIYSALGGAEYIDSVDLSNTYLDWAQSNFELNNLKAHRISSFENARYFSYRLIRDDVFSFIARAKKEKRLWDIIILDPPSFSNSKKMFGTLDLRRDYKELILESVSCLNKNGILWFSANVKNFSLVKDEFPNLNIQDMKNSIIDEDFRCKKIPSCYRIMQIHI